MTRSFIAAALAALFLIPWLARTPDAPRAVWVYLDPAVARGDVIPLSPPALERRARQGIPLDNGDRALDERLIAEIAATGAEVRVRSRWLGAVSVAADRGAVRALRRLEFVTRLEPVQRGRPAGMMRADSATYGANFDELSALGIPQVHDLGFQGTGVKIAIIDTGFERQHEALFGALIGGTRDFINGDDNVANQPGDNATVDQERHGTWVWSLLAANEPGLMVGAAYNATFYLAKTDLEPGDTRADEDRWVAAAEWADSVGADIISSSMTFRYEFTDREPYPFDALNGRTTPVSLAADAAARRGILVVQAMGNTPPADGSLFAPADADDILAVGAIDLAGNPVQLGAATTARGPTADGRIKPELVAPAQNLVGASSVTLISVDQNLAGTSFATPLIAGGAALFMQAWPNYNASAVRRALLFAGSNTNAPNNIIGWGVPNFAAAIAFPEGINTTGVAPLLLNNSVGSITPTFKWTAIVHPDVTPVRYNLQIARDSAFTQVIISDTVSDAFTYTLRVPLRAGERLFWRVVARTPTGITRTSDIADAFTVPEWVRLTSLATSPSSETDSVRPTFTWEPLQALPPVGPLTYEVQVLRYGTDELVQRVAQISGTSLRLSEPLTPNLSYRWRVIATTAGGVTDTIESNNPFVVNSAEAPAATLLYQNFPNPFPNLDVGRLSTTVWFDLAETALVTLSVHDLRGRLVRSLIPAEAGCGERVQLPPGLYGRGAAGAGFDESCVRTQWDGRDHRGDRVPAGVYVLRLVAGREVQYRRMLYKPE